MTFNKYLLAIASSAVIASPLYAATIYKTDTQEFNIDGRAEVRGYRADGSYDDTSRVRLNLAGSNALSDDLTVFGRYEFEIKENDETGDTDISSTRHLYVGADTNYGTVIYGHQNNAVTYLTDFSDQAETFSGYINEFNDVTADRSRNTLRYSVQSDGLTFQVSGTKIDATSTQGFGAVVGYKVSPAVEVAAGFTSAEVSDDTTNTYLLGAKYSKDSVYLAATGLMGDEEGDDFEGVDAFAAYYFGENAVNMSYSYYSKDDSDDDKLNFIGLEYARYIDNFAVYGSYKIALSGDTADGDEEDAIQVGARYKF
ncbi:porin [Psychromonas sp. B3M02]|uniref:porin n=1 Tax=Psychromonas sp. B3M02 TaxID=2267226 RepID=UPI000DE87DB4|nr:porin [Psychromonas sp. B3M02]RBW46438.1 porin [Psychromonas sp. B3M02]